MNGSLILIDSTEAELDLFNSAPEGVWVSGFKLPLPQWSNTFAEPSGGEGRRRTHTRPGNGQGELTVAIGSSDPQAFAEYIDQMQAIVASIHAFGGTLTYEPPKMLASVTWEIEAISITGWDVEHRHLGQEHTPPKVEFECRPFGSLAPIQIAGGGS